VELAERLIRMFSFAGDSVLDPFVGAGSTLIAAMQSGRNSVGIEIDPEYLEIARRRLSSAINQRRFFGATEAELIFA
jgi:site-specific DNA-methyltransferase (adenine-specific)